MNTTIIMVLFMFLWVVVLFQGLVIYKLTKEVEQFSSKIVSIRQQGFKGE